MAGQLARVGLAAEFFPATDGADAEVASAVARLDVGPSGYRLVPGAYACFQSHRRIWQTLVQSGDGHAMILEDDMVLSEGMAGLLSADWLPSDADIVKLETRLVRVALGRPHHGSLPGRKIRRLHSSHFGTGCYVISRAAAERLLEMTRNPIDPIDEVIFDDRSAVFRALTLYQMFPAPAVQGNIFPGAETVEAWTATSIENRLGTTIAPAPERKPVMAKIARRLRGEVSALLQGLSYKHISFR